MKVNRQSWNGRSRQIRYCQSDLDMKLHSKTLFGGFQDETDAERLTKCVAYWAICS